MRPGAARPITVTACDNAIELLTERIVGCGCKCVNDLAEIERWKRRRADLIATLIPAQPMIGQSGAGE